MSLSVIQMAQAIIDAIEGVTLPTTDTAEGKAHAGDVFRGVIGFEPLESEDRAFAVIPGLAVRNLMITDQSEYRVAVAIQIIYQHTTEVWDRISNDAILIADTLHDLPAVNSEICDVRLEPGTIQPGPVDNTLITEMTIDVVWHWG